MERNVETVSDLSCDLRRTTASGETRLRAPSKKWGVVVGGSIVIGCAVGATVAATGMPATTITLAGPVAAYAFSALEKWAEEAVRTPASGGIH